MRSDDRHRLPVPLGRLVEAELERMTPGRPGTALTAVVRLWPSAVGEAIARNAWPARLTRDGSLIVHVASSAWAHELTHLEEAVRNRLGEPAPARLKFVVGPIPEPASPEPGSDARRGAVPSPNDEQRAESLAQAIEHPKLRETVKKAAALSLAASRSSSSDRTF